MGKAPIISKRSGKPPYRHAHPQPPTRVEQESGMARLQKRVQASQDCGVIGIVRTNSVPGSFLRTSKLP
jgi:hypothetical protein